MSSSQENRSVSLALVDEAMAELKDAVRKRGDAITAFGNAISEYGEALGHLQDVLGRNFSEPVSHPYQPFSKLSRSSGSGRNVLGQPLFIRFGGTQISESPFDRPSSDSRVTDWRTGRRVKVGYTG